MYNETRSGWELYYCSTDKAQTFFISVPNEFALTHYYETEFDLSNLLKIMDTFSSWINLPLDTVYQIGSKITDETTDFAKFAKGQFIHINTRNKLIIYTFCLFCIRYHPTQINRDLRRKICKLVWIDKNE